MHFAIAGGIAQHTSNRQHTGDQTALHRIMGGQLSLLQRMDMRLMDARILTILHQDDDVSAPEVWKDKNWVQMMPQKHALCIKIADYLPFHLHTSFGTGDQSHVHTELMMCS